MRRLGILAIAALVAVLGIGALGYVVHAQTATPDQDTSLGAYIDEIWNTVASKLGVTRSDLDKAVSEARQEVADKAVADGALTQEQADRIAEGPPRTFGFGHQGRRGGHMPGSGHGPCMGNQEELAAQLGMTTDELAAELEAGKTIDEIAKEKGVDLEAARLDAMKSELARKVEAGEITQEQADWMLQGMENGYMGGSGGHMGMFGPMGKRDWRQPDDESQVAPESEDTSDL